MISNPTISVIEQIVPKMPGCVYLLDKDGFYRCCNETQAILFGLKTSTEILHKTNSELPLFVKHPDLARVWDANHYKVMQLATSLQLDAPGQNIAGHICTLSYNLIPLLDNKNIVGILGISLDLPEIKENPTFKQQQHKPDLAFKHIIDNLPEHVYWKNKKGQYLGCNLLQAKDLDLEHCDDIIGKTDYDLSPKEKADAFRKVDNEILSNGIRIETEEIVIKNGQSTVVLSKKIPLYDDDQKIIGLLGISFDISERKKMEQDLRTAKEAAETSAQSKAAFIANMSHDLRTPLSGIIGLSTMIENGAHNADERQNAQWIHDSGEQLLILLNGILDVVAAENLGEDDIHNQSFDLREFIESLVQLELPTTKSHQLDLKVKIDSKVPTHIISDRMKLHRILLNLLGNAIKFTKTGSITIEITSINNTAADVHLQFDVADTGIGIPLELQDKVFDRFYRVTPSYKGTYAGHGIGLDIAQSYVNLLGGHITLTSQEGVGTTFHFDLPCKIGNEEDAVAQKTTISAHEKITPESNKPHTPAPVVEAMTNKTPSADNNAAYILLVEDNPIALNILESLMDATSCRFESAIDGEQALELATTHEFNLILTDIGLPGLSGHEFTEQFRTWEKAHKKNPTPVVGLTAHARDNAINDCLHSGMDDVYTKPATLTVIQSILQEYHLQDKKIEIQNPQLQDEPKLAASITLGNGLPDTEDELFAMDAFLLFSPSTALEYVGGNKTLLLKILNAFLSGEQKDIHKMTVAYKKKDWDTLERLAHKLKGGLGYTGLIRMTYACQYLERYYKAGYRDLDVLDKLYQQVIDINQESIKKINSWMKNFNSN